MDECKSSHKLKMIYALDLNPPTMKIIKKIKIKTKTTKKIEN